MQHSEAFLKLVNDAKTRVREERAHDTKRRLDTGETFHLVDTREESEWSAGHIPGAIHLSRGVIERDIEKNVPDKNAVIILY